MSGDRSIAGHAEGPSAACGAVLRTVLVGIVALGAIALAPTGTAAAGPEPGGARLETFELPSALVDTSTPGGRLSGGRADPTVNVLLPAGYDDHPDRRYPVLWFLHGANGGANSQLGNIAELAEGLPAIVVMPDGGTFGMYTDWWNGGGRGEPAWATYHLQVLRPELEERYRILPGRRWHTVLGISMGGQGALRYAAMLPGYFGTVVALSAAFPDMRSVDALVGLSLLGPANGTAATYLTIFGSPSGPYAAGNSPLALAPNYQHTRMYLTSGNGTNCPQDPPNPRSYALDIVTETSLHAQQARFAAAARAAGADVTAVTTCGVHTFGVWDRAFAAARAWGLFEPVPERPTRWVHRTSAATGTVWGLDYRFAEAPERVVELRRSGSTITARGAEEVQLTGTGGQHCRLHEQRTSCELDPARPHGGR